MSKVWWCGASLHFLQAHERGLRPKATLSCAGYKALTSMEEYTQLLNTSLPGGTGNHEYYDAVHLK